MRSIIPDYLNPGSLLGIAGTFSWFGGLGGANGVCEVKLLIYCTIYFVLLLQDDSIMCLKGHLLPIMINEAEISRHERLTDLFAARGSESPQLSEVYGRLSPNRRGKSN